MCAFKKFIIIYWIEFFFAYIYIKIDHINSERPKFFIYEYIYIYAYQTIFLKRLILIKYQISIYIALLYIYLLINNYHFDIEKKENKCGKDLFINCVDKLLLFLFLFIIYLGYDFWDAVKKRFYFLLLLIFICFSFLSSISNTNNKKIY